MLYYKLASPTNPKARKIFFWLKEVLILKATQKLQSQIRHSTGTSPYIIHSSSDFFFFFFTNESIQTFLNICLFL